MFKWCLHSSHCRKYDASFLYLGEFTLLSTFRSASTFYPLCFECHEISLRSPLMWILSLAALPLWDILMFFVTTTLLFVLMSLFPLSSSGCVYSLSDSSMSAFSQLPLSSVPPFTFEWDLTFSIAIFHISATLSSFFWPSPSFHYPFL